jgi:phosphotransferase system enzyme I (PtsP)
MAQTNNRSFSFQVHDRGDRTLDGIFRLISLAEAEEPLESVLTAMCGDVAGIAHADVASVYVREEGPGGPRFTMRGNVGFPPEALGQVHLRVGEGITGFAAARLRPVSVAIGERDEHFKYIPGLGEERFPSLLAVPVLRGGEAAGVLVLQRADPTGFNDFEITLATALAAVLNHALERAAERARQRERDADRRAVHLVGTQVAPGAAMGRAEILPTLTALSRTAAVPGPGAAREMFPARLKETLHRLDVDLRRAVLGARGGAASEMASLALILEDERFRTRLTEACAADAPLKALSELARAYARVPWNPTTGAAAHGPAADAAAESARLMGDRAAEIEDLCVLVHAAGVGGRPLVRNGAIVVTERLRLFSTLHAIASGAAGFVVDGVVDADSAAVALIRAARLPLLGGVLGVFSWVRPDDLLALDAEAGVVQVNPAATTVARFRNSRR